MDSDIKILKLLLGRKNEKFTIKKMAETLKMNYRIAYEQAMKLEKEGLIGITRTGNSNICEFTYGFDGRVYEAECLRRAELFRKNSDFRVMYKMLSELKFPFIALLFGSHAKGTAGKHSDIDILAIGGDEKEIRSKLSLLPDNIHLTAVSYKSFIDMAKSKKFTVGSEAMENNVILIGIEEYYRLLKNANSMNYS
jgi:predicted nucleotidyltransferase